MFIPLTCDAPIYHWPFATVGLIVANTAAFIFVRQWFGDDPDTAELAVTWLLLEHGNGVHPVQWLTNNFMHANIMHLLGNMLFLWIFGLIVEGKLGWWKFLLVYLGIGLIKSAVEQIVMLGAGYGASLGASSAIYGIMAIALLWAPKNDINCFYWFAIWAMGTVDVPILFFVLIYVAFDVLWIVVDYTATGSVMGTGLLHVMGAAVGVPIGVLLLKVKVVDCEGWDLFHVWNGADPKAEVDNKHVDAQVAERKKSLEERQRASAKEQFKAFLAAHNFRAAATLYKKAQQIGQGFTLGQEDLLTLIQGLHASQEWTMSAPLMAEFIDRFPNTSAVARIKLAQICVTELQRPAKALELLEGVDFRQQSEKHITLARKIAKRAKQAMAEGVYELEDEVW